MITGPFSLNQQTPPSRPPAPLPFDPRPWPLVVLMLAGLFAVYFALRPASPDDAQPTKPSNITVPTLPDAKSTIEQGITLTFQQGDKTDLRSARLISLYVPEKTSPTPFLSPGAFTATFSGYVNLRLRGEFTFSVLGRGKVVVKINGQPVLEAAGDDFADKASALLKMEKGKNPIEVIYTAPEKGDAWLRLLRTSRDFPPEPVQPTVLSHDVADKPLRQSARLRQGRELLADLRCTNCHANPTAADASAHPMPELQTDAPDLSTAGARLKQTWMAAWIANPKALRPEATMPRLFHSAHPTQAADLAAYLATLGKPANDAPAQADDEAVTQGSQLFAALGCIGCHTKPDADEVDPKGERLPLKFINAKFQPGALKAWLMNPQEHYKSARMPNFHLTDFEADRLVGYLVKNAKGEVPADAKGNPAKGKELFTSAGCSACHTDAAGRAPQTGPHKTMSQLLESSDWNKGCLAADDAARGIAPDFALNDDQRSALKAIAATGLASLHNDVLPEYAERAVRQLQCTACHSRDEVEDRWSNVADEVGDLMPPDVNIESDQTDDPAAGPKLFVPRGLGQLHGGDKIAISGDQTRPPLTWTGEKLRPEWMAKFINGEIKYKPRYWLRSRMPAFTGRGEKIAQGLALEHGVPPTGSPPPAPKPDLADIGQKLVGRDGGFQCITCHSIVDRKAVSPFEAPGPNLLHVPERLNHDYYIRWMRKPMQFQPGTKMPVFGENGKTTLREILDGDADKQFDAIWNYVLQGEKMTPPE